MNVKYNECAHHYAPDTSLLSAGLLGVRCTLCGNRIVAQLVGDARAQLWARVYAAEFDSLRRQPEPYAEDACRTLARREADAAVRDFDEQYLGGKR